jgi:Uma2 family endonuclease
MAHHATWLLARTRSPSVRFALSGQRMHTPVLEQVGPSVSNMTVEEFLVSPLADKKAELVRGELRVTPPPGGPHGLAGANLVFALAVHVRPRGLGLVLGDAFGYVLTALPRTVRVPDGSFVRADRLPSEGVGPGLVRFAPDMAIEVLSPSDTASSIEERLDDYAAAGTAVVVVVDPVRRSVMVVPTDGPVRHLHEGDTLEVGEVLPGFSMPVVDIFAGIARPQPR